MQISDAKKEFYINRVLYTNREKGLYCGYRSQRSCAKHRKKRRTKVDDVIENTEGRGTTRSGLLRAAQEDEEDNQSENRPHNMHNFMMQCHLSILIPATVCKSCEN